MKYEIISTYSENKGRHTIVETFNVSSITALKKQLGDTLDMYMIYPEKVPVEPDEARIYSDLCAYSDKDLVESEVKRMQKMWKLYNKILSTLNGDEVMFSTSIDKRWNITVKMMNT